MALTANRDLNRYVDQELRSLPVAASTHVFKGAIVGIDRATGYARGLVAGDVFAGIAYEEIDNTAGSGGDLSVRVYTQGDFVLAVAGVLQDDLGAPVYATADDTAVVAPATGSSPCGLLIGLAGAGQGIVRIQSMFAPQVEHAITVPLSSLTSAATSNTILITQRAVRVVSVSVSFNTKPDQGALDVGTDSTDPDELVNNFNLASLTNHTPAHMTLVGRDVAKNLRIWAKVGQASSTAGIGGALTLRYVEVP